MSRRAAPRACLAEALRKIRIVNAGFMLLCAAMSIHNGNWNAASVWLLGALGWLTGLDKP